MQLYDTVKLTNITAESTENLEISLYCLHLLNCVIKKLHVRITKWTFNILQQVAF